MNLEQIKAAICQLSDEDRAKLCERLMADDEAETAASIQRGLDDIAVGRVHEAAEALNQLRARYSS